MRNPGIITVSQQFWKDRKLRRAVKREVLIKRIRPSYTMHGLEILCESYKFDPIEEGVGIPHYDMTLATVYRRWRIPRTIVKVINIERI